MKDTVLYIVVPVYKDAEVIKVTCPLFLDQLFKMRDEGLIPEKITNQDFATIAKNLPKRIFEDLMKEEKELVAACGEYAGKACSSITMKIARNIVVGN